MFLKGAGISTGVVDYASKQVQFILVTLSLNRLLLMLADLQIIFYHKK